MAQRPLHDGIPEKLLGGSAPFTQALYDCGKRNADQYHRPAISLERRPPEVGSQVSSDLDRPQSRARALPARVQVLLVLILVFAVGAGIWVAKSRTNSDARDPDANGQSKKVTGVFYPTPAQ